MRIQTLETPELGNRSYVVDDGDVSVVIDPQRDLDRLEPLLDADVAMVLETHVHNDYVTGGWALARRTGAPYGVNAADPLEVDRLPLTDGQELRAGTLAVTALATPGHTPTHLSYLVRDLADPTAPAAVFSGGSLLFGTVGRTDLVSPDLTSELARAQHRSAHRLAGLPDATGLFPTHGFGSFCAGGATSGAHASTIADERAKNHALTADSVEDFVAELLASLSDVPRYYAHMAPLNRSGPEAADLLTSPAGAPPADVERLLASGATVVDLRPAASYARRHLAGSLSVGLGGQFATYVGWLHPWGAPLAVVGERPEQLEDARRQLARIGIEGFVPAWGTIEEMAPVTVPRSSYRRATFDDLAAERRPEDVVLDVRRGDEFAAERVRGARNVPLHDVEHRHGELSTWLPGTRVWVHCAGGFRAGTAASLLERHDVEVVHVDDGFARAVELGLTEPGRLS
jgi:hydroxyacylglutathione hydrolase